MTHQGVGQLRGADDVRRPVTGRLVQRLTRSGLGRQVHDDVRLLRDGRKYRSHAVGIASRRTAGHGDELVQDVEGPCRVHLRVERVEQDDVVTGIGGSRTASREPMNPRRR